MKAYKKYIDNVNKTGAPPIPQPSHFDILHGLLRGSHSIEPRNLFESGRTMACSLQKEMIAFAPTDEDLDADHELPPPAVLSAPTEGGKRVAPTGRSGCTEASIALASAGPSTSGTRPTGRSVRTEAGIGVAGAGPSTGVTGSAGSSTHTEASTPVTGAGPSRS